jgi:hypothetical protein
MREPRMLGSLISKISEAELPDTPEPLKFGCIDQRDEHVTGRCSGLDADDVVNRIAVYSLHIDH